MSAPRCCDTALQHGIKPTKLFGRNADVDKVNKDELDGLAGGIHTFVSEDEVRPLQCSNVDEVQPLQCWIMCGHCSARMSP